MQHPLQTYTIGKLTPCGANIVYIKYVASLKSISKEIGKHLQVVKDKHWNLGCCITFGTLPIC